MKRVFNPYVCIAVISLAGLAGMFSIRNMDMARSVSREGIAMDTVVRISVTAPRSKRELSSLLDEAFGILGSLEKKLSMYDETSQISLINFAAGKSPVSVDDEVFSILKPAFEIASLTGGAFDPTIGPVTNLWKKHREGIASRSSSVPGLPTLPDEHDLRSAARLVDYRSVTMTDSDDPGQDKQVFLKMEGMMLDLGGIGKGYASAALAEFLSSRSIGSALIDLGGNVVAVGCKPDGTAWRIGVQDPDAARGKPLLAVEVCNASVITAGVYERSWEIEGAEYTHIFDPKTGMPLSGDLRSVTVVTGDPAEGDALSTAFIILGVAMSLDLLRVIPGVDAIFISGSADGGKEIVATGGLKGSLQLLGSGYNLAYHDIQ